MEKIQSAHDQLHQAKQLLLEAGLPANSRFVREISELQLNLALFARLIGKPAA